MSGADGWTEAMRAGEFQRAWAITDEYLAKHSAPAKHTGPRHFQRIWRGEDLTGRHVLVRCYHGLGDTIQFLRFMPALRAIARRVTVWCQPELITLAERIKGVDRAVPLHDGTPDVGFDVDIEIMEVPHAIRAERGTVEMREPYLELPPSRPVELPDARDRLCVGLVWEVGNWARDRAIPAHLLKCLGGDGVGLYSLQRGPGSVQCGMIGARDVSTPDIAALGRLVQALDLVICVDTMVAHLVGALGCEAWVLLPSDCDWRWPATGDRSFWYPSLRLFHQKTSGDWAGVIDDVRSALRARARARQDHETAVIEQHQQEGPAQGSRCCRAQDDEAPFGSAGGLRL
ncbi:hypothetical protein [Bradyrhizobium sp. USDA 4486]